VEQVQVAWCMMHQWISGYIIIIIIIIIIILIIIIIEVTANRPDIISSKPERWGSPLVQEKYREEKACDKRRR
jgi:hypothetical protein